MAYFVHRGIFVVAYYIFVFSTSDDQSGSLPCLSLQSFIFSHILNSYSPLVLVLYRKTLVCVPLVYTRMKSKQGT